MAHTGDTRPMRYPLACLLLLALASCADSNVTAKTDSGTDASMPIDASHIDSGSHDSSVADASDAALDSSVMDASADAAIDAPAEAGPICECLSGPCCDGCRIKPPDAVCSDVYVGSSCSGTSTAWTTTQRQLCDGVTSGCNGSTGTAMTPVYCQVSSGSICVTTGGKAHCN